MDRVRIISEELLDKHHDVFGTDFQKNREQVESMAIVRSKMLRNRIAGYITRMRVKEVADEAEEEAEASEEEPQ